MRGGGGGGGGKGLIHPLLGPARPSPMRLRLCFFVFAWATFGRVLNLTRREAVRTRKKSKVQLSGLPLAGKRQDSRSAARRRKNIIKLPAMDRLTPPSTGQSAWPAAVRSSDPRSLDTAYGKLRDEVRARCTILDKTVRFKVAAWLKKLSEEVR